MKLQDRNSVFNFAHCLGIYSKSVITPLKWLSGTNIQPDILDTKQPYAPGYSPHLEKYLDAIVKYRPDECWRKIKKVKVLFDNKLIRYLLIRAVARYKSADVLRGEIEEYISIFDPKTNPELAFYAAMAGLPTEIVTSLIGNFPLPSLHAPEHLLHSDSSLHNFRMLFFVLGYEGNKDLLDQIKIHLSSEKLWWTDYLRYLLQAGECVGMHWAHEQTDWFDLATATLDIILHINQGERERIIESLELCRDELAESLFWLTEAVVERYPDRLEEWFKKLESLQDSKIWTIHYGIMELIRDYTFELIIYDRLSLIPQCRRYIDKLIDICNTKFRESELLKGGSRSNHFLRLAAIAARCGFKTKAEELLQYGIKSTLIYGYHKDITLFQLVDIMGMLNNHDPDHALERCAEVLEMVDWMPHLTDGKETKALPEYIFKHVAKIDKNAAIRLLHVYARNKARWQMQDCLAVLIDQTQDAVPEVLWALTAAFSNHFSADGRHPNQVVTAKEHAIKTAEKLGNSRLVETLKNQLDRFIRTSITPRHWSASTSEYWQSEQYSLHGESSQIENSERNREVDVIPQEKTYILDGKEMAIQEIKDQLSKSFTDYREILEKLKDGKAHFYEPHLINPPLSYHISQASTPSELLPIKEYLNGENRLVDTQVWRELSYRFLDLGDEKSGLECIELAYSNEMDWLRWEKSRSDFGVIVKYDAQKARNLLVRVCYHNLTEKEYGSFDIPSLIASAYDVLGDIDGLKKVYQDYLQHCQELFEQMPKREEYKWLKSYSSQSDDFSRLAIHFLINELDTPEVDLAKRLLDACHELCLEKPEITLPIFIDWLSETEELIRNRLFTILYMVAFNKPDSLTPYADKISSFIGEQNFQHNMIITKLLQFLTEKGNCCASDVAKEKLNLAFCHYRPTISKQYPFLVINPSADFSHFFEKYTVKWVHDQISACCRILSIDEDSIIAKIEHVLKQEGWTEKEGKDRFRYDCDGNVHAQGFPYIPIITSFDLKVLSLLNMILDEIAKGTRLTEEQIEGLWRILQPADPEYGLSYVNPKPDDIQRLVVSDSDSWLHQLSQEQDEINHEPITQEWTTIFEQRVLSQDKTYEVPYRSVLLLHSCLIRKGLLYSVNVKLKIHNYSAKPRANVAEKNTQSQ